MISASASGVCSPALWNSTMEPGLTLPVTRFVISAAEMPFQSRLSPSYTKESPLVERVCGPPDKRRWSPPLVPRLSSIILPVLAAGILHMDAVNQLALVIPYMELVLVVAQHPFHEFKITGCIHQGKLVDKI